MAEQNYYRKQIQALLDEYGVKLTWVSEQMDWEYTNLNKFKNGKVNISEKRLIKLKQFLSKYNLD